MFVNVVVITSERITKVLLSIVLGVGYVCNLVLQNWFIFRLIKKECGKHSQICGVEPICYRLKWLVF